MEFDNQYLYLTSNSSIQPLVLDYSVDYVVALINFLHPKYYSFLGDNDDFPIKVVNVWDVGLAPPL